MKEDPVVDLFAYGLEERRIFRYINDYMEKIEAWRKEHSFDRDQLLRFMIAGLYLEFAASWHQGEAFDTILGHWSGLDMRPRTKKMLEVFNQHFGKEIQDADEYLSLLGLRPLETPDGVFLVRFVLSGNKEGQQNEERSAE